MHKNCLFKDIPHRLFNGDLPNSEFKTQEELSLFVEKYRRENIKQKY